MKALSRTNLRPSIGQRASVSRRAATVQLSRPPCVRAMASFYDLSAKDIDGNTVSLETFKGKVVLITNVACYCGYTSGNYKELVQLHEKYHADGLEVIAFPCNQFGAQEPGSPEQIKDFVAQKGVQFKVMEKIDVNGANTHPVYQYLKSACTSCAGDVRWNFAAKFLVNREGVVVERNGDSPNASEGKIKQLLGIA